MTDKRQINGTKYNVSEIVENAIAQADGMILDTEKAKKSLSLLGNRNPADTLVIKYARESAILNILASETGANFSGQIGKIDFSDTATATAQVNSYLNRRIQGQRSRWSR